jgi:hypothetical protein
MEKIKILFVQIKWKNITAAWFEWLGWFCALGAIGYTAEKTNVLGLQIIYGISYLMFLIFIQIKISEIIEINLIKNKTLNKVLTLLLSIILLGLTIIILHQSLNALLKG